MLPRPPHRSTWPPKHPNQLSITLHGDRACLRVFSLPRDTKKTAHERLPLWAFSCLASKSRATVNHHGLRTFVALQHAVLRVYNRLLSSCSSTGGVQAPLRPSGVKTPTLRKSAGIGALHCVASSGWSPQLVFHPPTSLGHFVCYFYGLPAVWPITSYCETQVCAQPDKTIC